MRFFASACIASLTFAATALAESATPTAAVPASAPAAAAPAQPAAPAADSPERVLWTQILDVQAKEAAIRKQMPHGRKEMELFRTGMAETARKNIALRRRYMNEFPEGPHAAANLDGIINAIAAEQFFSGGKLSADSLALCDALLAPAPETLPAGAKPEPAKTATKLSPKSAFTLCGLRMGTDLRALATAKTEAEAEALAKKLEDATRALASRLPAGEETEAGRDFLLQDISRKLYLRWPEKARPLLVELKKSRVRMVSHEAIYRLGKLDQAKAKAADSAKKPEPAVPPASAAANPPVIAPTGK